MLNSERIQKMEEYIMENKIVTMNALCKVFNISINTLRADISKLVSRGSVGKIYGGVQYIDPGQIPALEDRETKNMHIKRELCRKAAEFIERGDVVYIDAGSTVSNLIDYVDQSIPFTVVTSSLDVMIRASKAEQIALINMHGKYLRETGSFVSPESNEAIKKFNIKTAIMSVTSISDTGDFTISNFFEYEIKKAVVEQSSQTIMLADSSKIGVPMLRTFATLDQLDYLITDSDVPKAFLKLCENKNVKVLTINVEK